MTRKYHQPCPHSYSPHVHRSCPATPCQCRRRFLRSPRRHLPTGTTSSRLARQCLYREAHSVVLRDLDDSHLRQELARLQQQVADLQTQVSKLQAQRPFRVLIDTDKQAEFASTAQAEGVSLPVARRLCACLSRPAARPASPPWVASPSRPVSAPDSCWKFWINRLGHTSARPPRTKSSLAPSRCSWSSNPRASVGSAVACPPAATAPPGPANSGNYPLWSMWAQGDGGTGLANGLARVQPGASGELPAGHRRPARSLSHVAGRRSRPAENPRPGRAGLERLPRKPTRKWLNKTARVKH